MTNKQRLKRIELAARKRTGEAMVRTFIYYGTTQDGKPIENPTGQCNGQPMTLAEWREIATPEDICIEIVYTDEQPQTTITEGLYSKTIGIDAGEL